MDYLLAIQPSPLDSQDAPFITLSTARIILSPSCPRSTGSLFSDLNCSLTIIFHLLYRGEVVFVYIEIWNGKYSFDFDFVYIEFYLGVVRMTFEL